MEGAAAVKAEKVYTPVSDMEQRALWALSRVRFPPATGSKRFAREMQGATELTDRQRWFIWRIVWHFRRQIPKDIVEAAVAAGGNQKP